MKVKFNGQPDPEQDHPYYQGHPTTVSCVTGMIPAGSLDYLDPMSWFRLAPYAISGALRNCEISG